VSNTPGNLGNLLELFFLLDIVEITWKFTKSPGNCVAVFVICNAMAVSVQCIDIQLALLIICYFER